MLRISFVSVLLLTFLAVVTWQTNVEAQIVKDGLVGYWSLDKATMEGKTVKVENRIIYMLKIP